MKEYCNFGFAWLPNIYNMKEYLHYKHARVAGLGPRAVRRPPAAAITEPKLSGVKMHPKRIRPR